MQGSREEIDTEKFDSWREILKAGGAAKEWIQVRPKSLFDNYSKILVALNEA
jgi:hypothetical protein